MTTNLPSYDSRRNWRDDAACRTADPELFFPIGGGEPAALQAEEARRVCIGCPVRRTCLDWALDTGQDTGVLGGMTEAERRSLKRLSKRRPLTASDYGRRPKTRSAVPAVERVLARRDQLEEYLGKGMSKARIATLIGVEGATENVVKKAVIKLRELQAAEEQTVAREAVPA